MFSTSINMPVQIHPLIIGIYNDFEKIDI